jgi:PHP family Zn ribbon phosphoesterase
MNILLWKNEEELQRFVPERILEGILRMRKGEIKISPGHDGLYGKISLFSEEEKQELRGSRAKASGKDKAVQMDLF